ncbi:MAG: LysE family translocator, partial [Pseudomonadota bacterium]
ALFALVTSITPGPNNLMLMASGANFGLRRTVPHMLGVGLGFVAMALGIGLGLMQVFDAYPAAYDVLRAAGAVYMLHLAWKIARAAPPEGGAAAGKPMSFLAACAFQWVNVKAWAMAVTAVSLYAPSRTWQAVALVAVVFGAVNLPSVSLWAVLGVQLRRWLGSPGRLRAFNWTMAALLVASLWPMMDFQPSSAP